jgi:hypothetical protein
LRRVDWILDGGYLPHSIIRLCVRLLLKLRQVQSDSKSLTQIMDEKLNFIAKLRTQPIAIETNAANEQQYEVGTGVFAAFLGPRMKYSCAFFQTGNETLAEAETAMLREYIEKAEIKNGMTVLDLGSVILVLLPAFHLLYADAEVFEAAAGDLQRCILRRNCQDPKSPDSLTPEPRRCT